MIIELVLFVATVILLLKYMVTKPDKFPPGPTKWPLVGNMFQLKRWGPLPHISLGEAARRYGDVVGLYSGYTPVVLISSLSGIKEASSREDLAGRPTSLVQKRIDKGDYGVIMSSGERWKEQRRFTLRHLRDLGFGKRSLEGIAHEELEAVFEEVDRLSGGEKVGGKNPVCVHDILGTAGINVLWHIIAGERYSHTDPYLNKLMDNVKRLITISDPSGGVSVVFPIFTTLFPFWTSLPTFLELRDSLHRFIKDEIMSHRSTMDTENPRDFLDIYISEIEKQENNPATFFKEKQLVQTCVDLFMAGSDTTFNSLTFSVLYLILYPEVQLRVQEELDRVVGRDRLPSLEDRPNLPYVEATLNEVLRLSSVAPLAVPHAPLHTQKDIEFQGYIIPRKSRVILNLYALHHDPKIWGDPQNFRPERFLDEQGKVTKPEALMPFGTGKRACLGEALARNNLYLFFTGLVQRYSMRIPDGYTKPSEDPEGGLTLVPRSFKVQFQIRQ